MRSSTGRKPQSILQRRLGQLAFLLPFLVLVVILYLVGREKLLAPRSKRTLGSSKTGV